MVWCDQDWAGSIKDSATPCAVGGQTPLRPRAQSVRNSCGLCGEGADMAIAQAVVDQGEQFAGDGDDGDVAAAAGGDLGAGGDQPAGGGWDFLGGLDCGPADQGGTLFGDRAAVHGGVGLAVARGQPGPGAEVSGAGETREYIDELQAQGYRVEGGKGEDPLLVRPDGRAVETWREDYPYDEMYDRDTYEEEKYLLQIELLKFQSIAAGQRVGPTLEPHRAIWTTKPQGTRKRE
jgi:hypothetical protein